MTAVYAPGLTNINSLKALKGFKSTIKFTNRSFQLQITLQLDPTSISYMILIPFAVTS